MITLTARLQSGTGELCPGVTSSGKTYTMATMMQLSLEHLFSLISDAHDRFFLLRLSMLEIYNEVSPGAVESCVSAVQDSSNCTDVLNWMQP